LQWTIIASTTGPVASDFVHTLQAAINFIYKAQAPTFTDSSIGSLVDLLAEFHTYKQAVINAGLRYGTSGPIDHFEIPKLEPFHSFSRAIRNVGAPIQFTADVNERLLITHCKNPFEHTSHQRNMFTQQIVCPLDREARMHQFHLFTLLSEHGASLHNIVNEEFDEMTDTDPTLTWILHVSPTDHATFFLNDRPIHNHFLKGIVSEDACAAAHITIKPTHKS
jgi:hypothetical protein